MQDLRAYAVAPEAFAELGLAPAELPAQGFLWLACGRYAAAQHWPQLQALLARLGCGNLVDLHVSDLLNAQLRSQFESTSWYDLMVFRRLATAHPQPGAAQESQPLSLPSLDTSPVGFVVFERVLLTLHPSDCAVLEYFAQRLPTLGLHGATEVRGARLPASSSELMLRMLNHMVDGYLELRRSLSRHGAALQVQLLDTGHAFQHWSALLEARNALNVLEDTCEDQRAAVQEWIDALEEWPSEPLPAARRERELLLVRARDVQEHIGRVLTHVRRLEQSAEAAVQIHFSAQAHRTNDIMRTLTVLTAIFLPLNLITGFFGMNFDAMPLIHSATGIWVAMLIMGGVAVVLGFLFWRKRYLGTRSSG